MHDVIDNLLECQQTGRAFLKGFGNATCKLAPIERLVSAPVAFYHPQIGPLNFFVGSETISAAQTFTAAADTGTIPRLTGVDDFVITRPALGATHSVVGVSSTPFVVASMPFVALRAKRGLKPRHLARQ